jgi:hypothetical protein
VLPQTPPDERETAKVLRAYLRDGVLTTMYRSTSGPVGVS